MGGFGFYFTDMFTLLCWCFSYGFLFLFFYRTEMFTLLLYRRLAYGLVGLVLPYGVFTLLCKCFACGLVGLVLPY